MSTATYCLAKNHEGFLCLLRPHDPKTTTHLSFDNRGVDANGAVGRRLTWGGAVAAALPEGDVTHELRPVVDVGSGGRVRSYEVGPSVVDQTATMTQGEIAKMQGYSGEACGECGSMRTRRGTCLQCDDCGKTTGCG